MRGCQAALSFAKTPRRPNFIHVTCYTDSLHVVDFKCALSFDEAQPKNALPDGTRYEYDAVLKRTVEITPSGERFPVALVDGKLKRDLEKIARRKGEAT